jgi:hypothetical protein
VVQIIFRVVTPDRAVGFSSARVYINGRRAVILWENPVESIVTLNLDYFSRGVVDLNSIADRTTNDVLVERVLIRPQLKFKVSPFLVQTLS